eukprot:CAMPEP_0183744572 /NCGR_PEP_ID=MMETSP0737-20130205/65798_1 /TAXON_ID=385413 /ORGANISM="Thalassiosira miniscula, Strain CCMP1093" /LENGTH=685 /DNA_ID=CAMNT_0025980215 /DNA_START=204 /DNA_END=2262 /DNA_ORIENTATION=-
MANSTDHHFQVSLDDLSADTALQLSNHDHHHHEPTMDSCLTFSMNSGDSRMFAGMMNASPNDDARGGVLADSINSGEFVANQLSEALKMPGDDLDDIFDAEGSKTLDSMAMEYDSVRFDSFQSSEVPTNLHGSSQSQRMSSRQSSSNHQDTTTSIEPIPMKNFDASAYQPAAPRRSSENDLGLVIENDHPALAEQLPGHPNAPPPPRRPAQRQRRVTVDSGMAPDRNLLLGGGGLGTTGNCNSPMLLGQTTTRGRETPTNNKRAPRRTTYRRQSSNNSSSNASTKPRSSRPHSKSRPHRRASGSGVAPSRANLLNRVVANQNQNQNQSPTLSLSQHSLDECTSMASIQHPQQQRRFSMESDIPPSLRQLFGGSVDGVHDHEGPPAAFHYPTALDKLAQSMTRTDLSRRQLLMMKDPTASASEQQPVPLPVSSESLAPLRQFYQPKQQHQQQHQHQQQNNQATGPATECPPTLRSRQGNNCNNECPPAASPETTATTTLLHYPTALDKLAQSMTRTDLSRRQLLMMKDQTASASEQQPLPVPASSESLAPLRQFYQPKQQQQQQSRSSHRSCNRMSHRMVDAPPSCSNPPISARQQLQQRVSACGIAGNNHHHHAPPPSISSVKRSRSHDTLVPIMGNTTNNNNNNVDRCFVLADFLSGSRNTLTNGLEESRRQLQLYAARQNNLY